MYITRKLLGMEPMKRISPTIYRKLGLLGSLTTFRVAEKIGDMFGWAVNKMTIWSAVQKTASEIDFKWEHSRILTVCKGKSTTKVFILWWVTLLRDIRGI